MPAPRTRISRGLTEDSRRITPGMLFVAVPGTADDGHRHVGDAIRRGAAAVVVETEISPVEVPVVHVASSRAALAELAARFFGHPARGLEVIGFTGTFGKTSTSAILRDLLTKAGSKPGVLGSLGAHYDDFHDPGTGLTTPAPVELHRALLGLKNAGADTVILEVTSHALRLRRTEGLTFTGGLISAIKPGEHSDFHGSYDDYVAAKRLFLGHLSAGATLVFDADNFAARLLASEAAGARKVAVSLHGGRADVRLMHAGLDDRGAHFTVDGRRLHSSLLGRGHLQNVALALTYALAAGVTVEQARAVLSGLQPLRRRMDHFEISGRQVLDDTAGHPDSLQATFEVAAMLARSPAMRPGARVVVVYAIRGSRGEDINHRNALALADLVAEHGFDRLVVTGSQDVAGPSDRPIVRRSRRGPQRLRETVPEIRVVRRARRRRAIRPRRDRAGGPDRAGRGTGHGRGTAVPQFSRYFSANRIHT